MNSDTYYRDHWVEIEPERLEAYEQLFEWRPQNAPLLEPAQLASGQVVVDYGCGPGGLAVELARRVAPGGRVHGVDLNKAFLERAAARAKRDGVEANVSWHHSEDGRIPLANASVDRLICKNVMEYVPDVAATLAEFRRVLKPGGLAHVIDSDWGLFAVEPLGAERMAELFEAAKPAYRTPHIGRKLWGALRAAGFSNVDVKILAGADTKGRMSPVVLNMASYARASGRLTEAAIERLIADVKAAIADGTYLMVLPQFLVTGTA
jgi:SAM-dependent methyltransferase